MQNFGLTATRGHPGFGFDPHRGKRRGIVLGELAECVDDLPPGRGFPFEERPPTVSGRQLGRRPELLPKDRWRERREG